MIQNPFSTSSFFSWFRCWFCWNKEWEGNDHQIYLACLYNIYEIYVYTYTYEPHVDKERDTWSDSIPCTVSRRTGTLLGVLNRQVIWWKYYPEQLTVLWCLGGTQVGKGRHRDKSGLVRVTKARGLVPTWWTQKGKKEWMGEAFWKRNPQTSLSLSLSLLLFLWFWTLILPEFA